MDSEEKIIRNVGVDFGTSTSAIFYKDYHEDGSPVKQADEGTPVKFELTHNTLPTLIFDDRNGNTCFGHEAERRARSKPEGLKSAFKIDLVSEDPETVRRAAELTERFLAHLYHEYKSQSTVPHGVKVEERTLVSYPAKWPEEAREATLEAASKAGFPNVEGKEEPSAAMLYFLNVRTSAVEEAMEELRKRGVVVGGKPVTALLIDMGAGTTDFVLYRYTPGTNEYEFLPPVWPPVGHAGFGGREVDELLWERVLDPVMRSRAERLDAPYEVLANRFRRTAKAWKEEEVSPILRDDGQVEHLPVDFINLEAVMEPELGLDRLGLDRKRFREEVAEYLEHFPRLLRELVEHAVEKGSIESGEDVELVVLTGGHSQWYFINEMLTASESPLGKVRGESYRVVRGPHPQETVARGLAMTAPISRSSNSAWLRIGTKTDHETMQIHGRGTKLPWEKWITKEHIFSSYRQWNEARLGAIKGPRWKLP